MAEDWNAADDDLERLLEFDDIEVPSVLKSCKTIPSIDAKEDGMESTGKPRPVESSVPQAAASTRIVHAYASSHFGGAGRNVDANESSAIDSVQATFVIGSRVHRFSASTDSMPVRSKTLQLDTQLVASRPNGPDSESFRERNGGVTGDGRHVDTLRVRSASGNEKPDAIATNERQRRTIALPTVAVLGEVATVRPASGAPNQTGISQATNPQGREERNSRLQVENGNVGLEIIPETTVGLGIGFNVGSKNSDTSVCRTNAQTQGTGGRGWQRETGNIVSLQRRLNSCENIGTAVETDPLVSLPELPVQSQCNPRKGDSGAYVKSPAHQEAGSSERGSRQGLPYRIPGPAGALQENFRKRTSSGDLKTQRRSFGSDSQSDTTVFLETPWITAMEYLDGASKRVPNTTIDGIKSLGKHLKHIPELVSVIKAIVPNGFGDVSVVLKDPTGTINGCIHRSVLTESKYGHGVIPGAVLILRKVTVFSPNPYAHYLNITTDNVHKVFGSEAGNARSPTSVAKDKTNNVEGNKVRSLAISSNDSEQVPPETSSISRQVGEPLVPRISVGQTKRQPGVRHDADVDRGIGNQFSAQKSVSVGSAKGLPDTTFATTLEDTGAVHSPVADVHLRNREGFTKNLLQAELPGARNTQDAEEKATQEEVTAAKAKAAGWDLGEDVELLLNDDLGSFLF